MRKLDENKLARSHTVGKLLDNKYGEAGIESRTTFHGESIARYYGGILHDYREQLKITQQELTKRAGIARSYVTRVKEGETDIQIPNFLRIARALEAEFTPTSL